MSKLPPIGQDITSLMTHFKKETDLIIESKEDSMYFSIILGILTVTTEFQESTILLSEIAAYELTDKTGEGGLVTFTLKGNPDELVYNCMNNNSWKEVKKWFTKNQMSIIEGMTKVKEKETKKARF
mgnify:CR=1 FL=1